MADVDINKFRASVVREGSKPASPGFIVSEGQDPVNPPGTNNYVPYSGATANVELGEFGVEAGFVTLDTTPTNIPTDQGAIYWDDTRSTAALIMNGTLQHIGQDSFFYVKNSSGSTIPKGTCVGFAGTDGGSGHLLVTPFLANGSVPSTYFMGVTAEAIANGSFGQVMHFGELEGINTSGFTAGALLYASSTVAGAFQTTAPVAPNNIILVAAAVNSKNNGAIVVRPTYGSNINTDEGVKITSPTTGDLLQLQAGGLWENKTLAQVIGSAYVPSTRTITINGTTQDLSADRTFNVGDMLLGDIQTVTARKDFNSNTLQLVVNGTSQKTILTNSPIDTGSYSLAINAFGFNASNNLYFSKGGNNNGIFAFSNSATRTYTLKDASGTLAFTSDIPSLSGYVQGSGTSGQVAYFNGTNSITSESSLFWDSTNDRLGIGITNPFGMFHAKSAGAYGAVLSDNTGTTGGGYFASLQNGSTKGIVAVTGAIEGNTTSDFGMFAETGGALRFYVNGSVTRVMTLTSGGNLLVGTTTDNGARLQVSGASTFAGRLLVSHATSGNYGAVIYNTSATGEGLVVRGGSTSSHSAFVVQPYDGSVSLFNVLATGAATFSSSVSAARFISSTSSSYTNDFLNLNIGTVGQTIGLRFGYDGSTYNKGAIYFISKSANGVGDLIFAANNSESSANVSTSDERMRITSGGNVLIGTTTDAGSKLRINQSGVAWAQIIDHSNASAQFYIDFRYNGTGTGSIIGYGTFTNFNTMSDYRLKEDLKQVNGLEKIKDIKIYNYKWKESETRMDGVLAHELAEVLPYAVTGQKNAIEMQQVDYSKLVPLLIQSIQELKKEIDTLKN